MFDIPNTNVLQVSAIGNFEEFSAHGFRGRGGQGDGEEW